MSLDKSVQQLVQRVMQKIGTPVTLRRVTVGAYDTATGTQTPSTEDVTVNGRLDDFTDRELLASGGSILARDRKLYFAAADVDVAPQEHDEVVLADDDVAYDVVNVVSEMVQHEPGMYVLQLRR